MEEQSELDKLVSEILRTCKPSNQAMKEATNQAVDAKNGSVPDKLDCKICHKLVFKPYSCQKCD